ncbi:MAG: DUF4147 domain-containing protein [Nitrosopumilus sp. H8]|nr:MAG: DUF4147 domain-containing protein [Nitrosopumilus sp. H13]RNJ79094.1 MAG: DUF4147 domain-containing protein [Nitrosopumilus sp. H8]
MIIQNFHELATSSRKKESLQILEAGLRAADPASIIPKFVTREEIKIGEKRIRIAGYSSIYTVAFGKAGDSMTRAFNAIVPVRSGIIVIPKGSRSKILGKKFQIFNSQHPRPDRTSIKAAKEIVKFLQNRRDGELVVFLVSGGGSSLLALPDGITLDDKAHATDLLLKSGATIQEFNCVRKHLSKIKGGKLVEGIRCDGVGLVMSDVEGDDLSVIASGATYADDTTYADALRIVQKYKLAKKMPLEVMDVLEDGMRRGDDATSGIDCHVIASNTVCLEAMKKAAQKMGYKTDAMQVFGDIKNATKEILGRLPEPRGCLVFGGETTVKVLGRGMGGRNQEMVLRLLKNTQKSERLVIASMGTDGIDGNSVFAGAITENTRTDTASIKEFLRESDSGRFFQKRGASIITGFTHTNLMDIGVILR